MTPIVRHIRLGNVEIVLLSQFCRYYK